MTITVNSKLKGKINEKQLNLIASIIIADLGKNTQLTKIDDIRENALYMYVSYEYKQVRKHNTRELYDSISIKK